MASVNKVIIVGNCGRDPEVRYSTSGKAVCNLSIATTSKYKNKDTGQTTENTEWHRVTFHDKLAEIVGEYVKKGMPLYVEGRLKYGKYTDQAGVEKNTTDIVASEMQMLGGRQEGSGASAPQGNSSAHARPAPARTAPSKPAADGFSDMDDDVPFVTASMSYDMTTSKARKLARYDY